MASIAAALMAASMTLNTIFGAASWTGSRPAPADLRGKVVLVDVFTFGCINCKHVVPELRKLSAQLPQRDFEILGIHSPETPYERERGNLLESLAQQGIAWPVAIDNDFVLWHAYGLQYWPTQLIFDRGGRLRKTVIGEGQDETIERTVLALMREK